MLTNVRTPPGGGPAPPAAAALHAPRWRCRCRRPALALSAEDGVWPIPASAALGAGKLEFDLPALSKFILLAAFIAARTPAGADAVRAATARAAAAAEARPAAMTAREGGGGMGLPDGGDGARKRKRGGGASGGGGAAALALAADRQR
jgi:uncharacterized membrane protein YgcG